MAAAMMLAACSKDDLIPDGNQSPDLDLSGIEENCYAIMPKINGSGNEAISRSALYYDYTTGGAKFSWYVDKVNPETNDKIGVSPVSDGPSSIQPYSIQELANASGLVGYFGKKDGAYQTFEGDKYVSYYPYTPKSAEATYETIPVSYEGQVQQSNPKIYYYRYRNTPSAGHTPTEYLTTYSESEKGACAHLPEKDYLTSGVTNPTPTGKLHFNMYRMGAIVRFFIVVPELATYDMLQVYNPNTSKPFVLTTTMNAKDNKSFNPATKTSNSMFLTLGNGGSDFTFAEYADGEDPIYKYSDTYKHLLIAYMMVAPVDLSGESDKECTLYLHQNYGKDGHKVFKAQLAKINLKRDWVNQWTIASMTEDPIIFGLTELSVQKWKEETVPYTNDGAGTQTW